MSPPEADAAWLEDSRVETLVARYTLLGIDPNTLTMDGAGTLVAADPGQAARLDAFQTDADTIHDHELSYGRELGRGGAAVVRAALQASLGREVAVKTPREDRVESASGQIVREGRILAKLQHPGVPPVHQLALGPGGRPVLLMKLVEGKPWGAFIDRTGRLWAPAGEADPLEWHLRVLIRICRALEAAHERGVLHRDIKPENVMVGRFGEVYLLDWGLAAALRADPELDLPLASEETQLRGTPGRMAPEMAVVEGSALTPRTDVYLLGTCLHSVLTGRVRHIGATIVATLHRALVSAPYEYPDSVAAELGRIANKATAADPDERHQNASEFREAISDFLEHRDSRRLAERTRTRLEAIPALEADPKSSDELRDALGACRFGFEQALASWPGNELAARGLREVVLADVRAALRAEDPDRARLLLQEVDRPPRSVLDQLFALDARAMATARKRQALEAMGRSVDTSVGIRLRSRIMWALAWRRGGAVAALGVLHRTGLFSAGYATFGALIALHLLAVTLVLTAFRTPLMSTAVNRRFSMTLGFSVLGPATLWPFAAMADLPLPYGLALLQLTYSVSCAMASVALDVRLAVSAAAFGAAFAFTVVLPAACYEILAVFTFAGIAYIARRWGRDADAIAREHRATS